MTEAPGQQPPQEPRNAPEGRREVLEGRVIPSRSHTTPPVDPRRNPAAGPPEPWSATPGARGTGPAPGQGQARAPAPAPGAGGAGAAGAPPRQGARAAASPLGGGGHRGGHRGGRRQTFPRQQGPTAAAAPAGTPASGSAAGTPDWAALAEEQAAAGARRRKVMMLTGGIVAVAVIAGGVTTAVVMSGGSAKEAVAGAPASSGAAASRQPTPEPPATSAAPAPPPNPLDYLSTSARDKAPLTPVTLFPGKEFRVNGRVYGKAASSVTFRCATGARSALARALKAHGCRELIRATYVNGAVAVTVGVAVFDDTAHAAKVQKVAEYLAPLNGGGARDFCHAVTCRMASNTVGHYAYFAIAGLKNGKTITTRDTAALRGADEASDFAFQRIIQRGRDAVAADTGR